MNQIHFIGGEKGGVGKSVVARLLAQYCIDRHVNFAAFDTDKSHGALMRFYSDYASPVVVDRYDSLDQLVEAGPHAGDRVSLVDMAAQTHEFLAHWLADSSLLESWQELGISLTYWHVMDSGRDSVDLLRRLLDQLGGKVGLVLVLNEIRGEDFELLEESGERIRALALGARVIRIRRLADSTMQKIDRHSSSFWAAVHSADPGVGALGLLERQRVKAWIARSFEQIESVLGARA